MPRDAGEVEDQAPRRRTRRSDQFTVTFASGFADRDGSLTQLRQRRGNVQQAAVRRVAARWDANTCSCGIAGSGVVIGTTARWCEIDLNPFDVSPARIGPIVLRASGPSGAAIVIDSSEGTNKPQLLLW